MARRAPAQYAIERLSSVCCAQARFRLSMARLTRDSYANLSSDRPRSERSWRNALPTSGESLATTGSRAVPVGPLPSLRTRAEALADLVASGDCSFLSAAVRGWAFGLVRIFSRAMDSMGIQRSRFCVKLIVRGGRQNGPELWFRDV